MSRATVAASIADKVRDEEIRQSHILGYDGFESYIRGWEAWSDTYLAMFEPSRLLVFTRFRTYSSVMES